MLQSIKNALGRHLVHLAYFRGSARNMLAIGGPARAASMSTLLCGDGATSCRVSRSPKFWVPRLCESFAARGGPVVISPALSEDLPAFLLEQTVFVPELVDLSRPLPDTRDKLQASLTTSTTREDLRRVRKADYSYRVLKDPDMVRLFFQRYVAPLRDRRFPEDGFQESAEAAMRRMGDAAELICLDREGEWVAGIFNTVRDSSYILSDLGVLDGRDDIRRMHATAALMIQSFERGVDLGLDTATLGRSLPFLGRGPIWFKAKWGGVLQLEPSTPRVPLLADLRHDSIRELLADYPIIHVRDGELVVATWLKPGERATSDLLRNVTRFPGVSRWCILGNESCLSQARRAFDSTPGLISAPVSSAMHRPLWLGNLLSKYLN